MLGLNKFKEFAAVDTIKLRLEWYTSSLMSSCPWCINKSWGGKPGSTSPSASTDRSHTVIRSSADPTAISLLSKGFQAMVVMESECHLIQAACLSAKRKSHILNEESSDPEAIWEVSTVFQLITFTSLEWALIVIWESSFAARKSHIFIVLSEEQVARTDSSNGLRWISSIDPECPVRVKAWVQLLPS